MAVKNTAKEISQRIDDMQTVGHHRDVIKAREQGDHLQNGTASIKNY